MKKILSLTLAVMLLVSAIPTAFAAETQDYSLGTAVTVTGAGGDYTVTVPATLTPGQTGTVTASGYWSSDEVLYVTVPSTVEVRNGSQTANINVSFDGIKANGNYIEGMNIPVNISIDNGGILFGEWTGIIEYDVELISLITFTIAGTEYKAEDGMTWFQWANSTYNTDGFECATTSGSIEKDGIKVSNGTTTENGYSTIRPNKAYKFQE